MKGLNRALVTLLILLLSFCLGLPKEASCQKEDLGSQKRLREEIQVLNLINGLYLSPEQMRSLAEKARKLQNIREDYIKEHHRYSDVATEALRRLKGELVEDKGEVSKDVARDIHKTQEEALKLKADYETNLNRIVKEVKNNLSSTQLHIIEEFKPCLVPPKGPARFGQADDPSGGIKQLERIRKIPGHRYTLKKYEFADRVLERALLHKPKGVEIDKDQMRNKILAIFDQAREFSEIDFNLEKEKLAKRLKEETLPKIKKEVDVDVRIERFLLNPAVISILEDKLRENHP